MIKTKMPKAGEIWTAANGSNVVVKDTFKGTLLFTTERGEQLNSDYATFLQNYYFNEFRTIHNIF